MTVKRARPPRDTPGRGQPPDPSRIQDTPALLGALREFRAWAGDPGYRVMAAACGQLVTATTMATALTGDRLPPLRTVLAVLRGCGATEEYEGRFSEAWKRCAGLVTETSETPASA